MVVTKYSVDPNVPRIAGIAIGMVAYSNAEQEFQYSSFQALDEYTHPGSNPTCLARESIEGSVAMYP